MLEVIGVNRSIHQGDGSLRGSRRVNRSCVNTERGRVRILQSDRDPVIRGVADTHLDVHRSGNAIAELETVELGHISDTLNLSTERNKLAVQVDAFG